MNKLESALTFIRSGISVIPLLHRSKQPALRAWEPYQTILSTPQEVHAWLASGWQNYGVVCGWCNLVVLDFDDAEAFSIWLDWFLLDMFGRIFPMPYIVKSARGAHVYIACASVGANERRQGVDVKRHGYVVGPGCTHPSGTQYVAMGQFHLLQVQALQSILPIELFPKIAPSPSCGHGIDFMGTLATDHSLKPTEYDPWQAAMFVNAPDLISEVKRRVRIETLFTDAQRTSANGQWLATKCIFHDDANPSAWIDVQRQLYGCTVCGFKPMDCINLYARTHNMSDADAVRAMAQELHIWG